MNKNHRLTKQSSLYFLLMSLLNPARSTLFALLATFTVLSGNAWAQPLRNSYLLDIAPDIGINAQVFDATISHTDANGDEVLWGWADMHAHQFSDLGFGGKLFFGSSWGHPADALKESGEHGDFGLGDLIGNSLRGGGFPTFGHKTGGYPKFSGWPRWNTYNHQTMYFKWLHRAYLGGQRLMVVHAVNNEVLCDIHPEGQKDDFGCEDMPAVDRQIAAIKNMELSIDYNDDGVLNDSGWYKVVYTPAEARTAIEAQRMAVVIGIEVDSLFGCNEAAGCSSHYVEDQVEDYYELGVRHLFPIHVFDNGFGGTAVNNELFNTGNYVINDKYYSLRECHDDERNDFQIASKTIFTDLLELMSLGRVLPDPDIENLEYSAHCNSKGLTGLGESLINSLMSHGMLIDVDHMSNIMFDEVYDLASNKTRGDVSGYPLVASHTTGLQQLKTGERAEGGRTDAELARIAELGGMVAVNLASKSRDRLSRYRYTHVPFNCSYSSQSWAHAYLYAVDRTTQADSLTSVAIGTDFNGFVTYPVGRFGNSKFDIQACGGEEESEDHWPRVVYPFVPHGSSGLFEQQLSGDRGGDEIPFDINKDGVAHVGLLPDMIQELKTLGMTDSELEPLFHSAEKYIRVWEKAESLSDFTPIPPLPPVNLTTSVSPGPAGVFAEVLEATLELAEADPEVTLYYSMSGANTIAPSTSSTGVATFPISIDGKSTLSYYSRNSVTGAQSLQQTFEFTIDSVGPTVSAELLTPKSKGDWHNSVVEIELSAVDSGTGIERLTLTDNGVVVLEDFDNFSTIYRIEADGVHDLVLTATDNVANESVNTASLTVKVDQTSPEVSLELTGEPNASGWYNYTPAVETSSRDSGSGLDFCSEPTQLGEGPGQTLSVLCEDLAGNTTSAEIEGIQIDTIAPVIEASISPPANPNGWHNKAVSVAFEGSDAGGSGILECSDTRLLSEETAGTAILGHCTDIAGNVAELTAPTVRIDTTPPVVSSELTPSANEYGWNNSDVQIAFTGTDNLSAVVTCSGGTTLTAETSSAGAVIAGSCVDLAGNESSQDSQPVRIDKTAPGISSTNTPPANAQDWNNSDVTVSFAGSDELSGFVQCSADQLITTEGVNLTAQGTCSDRAGNTASLSSAPVNLDKTAPVIDTTFSPQANSAGWHNTDVEVSFSGSDALSGLQTCDSNSITLTQEGAAISAETLCIDNAGNTASTGKEFNIDKTAPELACSVTPEQLWPANNKLVEVINHIEFDDSLSGTAELLLSSVESNQTANRKSDVLFSGFDAGSLDLTGQLLAQRTTKDSADRLYTMMYNGSDLAGNTASCSTIVTVPQNKGKK